MSLHEPPVKKTPKPPHLYLVSGVFALFAIAALVVGAGTSLVAISSPAAACGSGCGDNGGYDDNGDDGNDSGDCGGGCTDDGNTDDHDHGDYGDDGNTGDGDCGGCGDEGGDNDGNDGNDGNDADPAVGNANPVSGDPGEPWWERGHSAAMNSNRSGTARPTLFGLKKTITKERVIYVQPRPRIVHVQPRQRVIYVQPRRARIIRPRIVRQARPVYRTRLATRGARYPAVIYTAPAVRYAAPVQRRVIYSAGVEAYAARGRVGVETRRVVRSARGRVVVRSVSAYAQGRHARVRIGGRGVSRPGTRIYGAMERRGYASESYIYADDSGADVVTVGNGRYNAMMRGSYR